MWLRTSDGWYVHDVRGVNYVTWVPFTARENALRFPEADLKTWITLIQDLTGKTVQAVKPF